MSTCQRVGGGWEEGKQEETLIGTAFFRGMEMSWP